MRLGVAVLAGIAASSWFPGIASVLGGHVDDTLLLMVGLLFFGVRWRWRVVANPRFLCVVLPCNFIVMPLLGWLAAHVWLAEHPLWMAGLMIYFMAPCTDWFLGFTRLARGNVTLGATLIPINMTLQLLLYPLFLQWFTQSVGAVPAKMMAQALWHWFLLPLALALIARWLLRRSLNARHFMRVLRLADDAAGMLLALLVMQIFAGNSPAIASHLQVFPLLLGAVFVFFAMGFALGEFISRIARFAYPEHALFSISIAARNAPLMLAATMVAWPGQPLVYAALIVGMLVEFPHLALLQRLLLRRWRMGLRSAG